MSTGEPLPATSTPPAWQWLEERYVPVPYPGAFAAMAEDQYESLALSTDPRNLPDADSLREQDDSEPPIDSRKTPVSAALRERNGHDPTGEDIWPLDRDQCPDCDGVQSVRERPNKLRVGARNEHPERDCTAQMTDSVINAVPERAESCVCGGAPEHRRGGDTWPPAPDTASSGDAAGSDDNPAWVCGDCGEAVCGKPCEMATWHEGTCGICGKDKAVTEARDFGGRKGMAFDKTFPEALYEMLDEATNLGFDVPLDKVTAPETTSPADSCVVESCPECGAVTDIDYGTVNDGRIYEPEPARSAIGAGPLFGSGNEGADRDPDLEWDGPPLSLTSQLRLYGLRVDGVLDRLRLDLDDLAFRDRIVALGAKRLADGYPTFGDAMYHWTALRRGQEGDEEIADFSVYGTSGSIE